MKMFWGKKDNVPNSEKLPSPKEIPMEVGRYLVTNMHQNPDVVWHLKAVLRPKQEDKNLFDYRVFDDRNAASKKIKVKDFNTLTEYPDLILFEGTLNKKTSKVSHIEKQKAPA
jgi:hypothetical protein